MKYLKILLTVLLFSTTCPFFAQSTTGQLLMRAYTLEREGKPSQAIAELQPIVGSTAEDALSMGKAWNIQGLAFEDLGDFAEAQRAYEHAIGVLESLPNNIRDYAMALDDFGGLYVATGQFEIAGKMRSKAFHIYESVGDHAGMARISSDLAGVAFSQKKVHEGKKFLERAMKEMRWTHDLDDDDLAAIASMRGWLAHLEGDAAASVSAYQLSLRLWKKQHGEEHPFTGWGYMLLGDAYAEAGETTTALGEMKQGIAILGHTLSLQNPRYLTAEIAYSRVLDTTGNHSDAVQMRASAERLLKEFNSTQCAGCTISAAAFR